MKTDAIEEALDRLEQVGNAIEPGARQLCTLACVDAARAELAALEEENVRLRLTAKYLDEGAGKLRADNAAKDKSLRCLIAWAEEPAPSCASGVREQLKADLEEAKAALSPPTGKMLVEAIQRMKQHTDGNPWYWLSYGDKCYAFATVEAYPEIEGESFPTPGTKLEPHDTDVGRWVGENGTAMIIDGCIAEIETQNGDVICSFIAKAHAFLLADWLAALLKESHDQG